MRLSHQDFEYARVLKLQGDLAVDDVATLRKMADECMGKTGRDFVVDMTELEYIDSQGLETLLWLQEKAGENLHQLRLAGLTAQLRKVLEITRLLSRFDLHPDVDSALKSLRM